MHLKRAARENMASDRAVAARKNQSARKYLRNPGVFMSATGSDGFWKTAAIPLTIRYIYATY